MCKFSQDGRSALYLATEYGQTAIIRKLLCWVVGEQSASKQQTQPRAVLSRTEHGDTLAHLAAEKGHVETLETFLSQGVPVFMPNKVHLLLLSFPFFPTFPIFIFPMFIIFHRHKYYLFAYGFQRLQLRIRILNAS